MKTRTAIVVMLLCLHAGHSTAEPLILSGKDLSLSIDQLPLSHKPDPIIGLQLRYAQLVSVPDSQERRALSHALILIRMIRNIQLNPEAMSRPVLHRIASSDRSESRVNQPFQDRLKPY